MNQQLLDRITTDPAILLGKPTIRGLRISVEHILTALAAGVPVDDLLADYPELESEDIQAAITMPQHQQSFIYPFEVSTEFTTESAKIAEISQR